MKKAIYFFILATTATLFILSCKKQAVNNATYNLKLKECSAAGKGFIICFDSLITDSRCPSEVVCVWGGVAAGKFSFKQNGNVVNFNLATANILNFHTDTVINQVKISLQNILPYPKSMLPSITPVEALLKIN
jgi:hypothetical protein